MKPEFKIGIATIVALVVLYFGIQYLKGVNALRVGSFYYLKCHDIGGLTVSSHVKIHGYQVGIVRGIEYDYTSPEGIVLVTINTDSDLRLPRDSRIEVSGDLLGTDNIVITPGTSEVLYAPGDTIDDCPRASGLMDSAAPIVDQLAALMPKMDTLIGGLGVLVNESKVQQSLLDINTLVARLGTTVDELNRLLRQDMPALMASTTSTMQNLDTLSAQVKDARVDQLLTQANATLQHADLLLSGIQQGEGSVGKLVTTTELHDELASAIASVDSLICDIKAHPRRYISIRLFGRDRTE